MTTSCARSRASSLVRIRLPDSADEQAYVPALDASGYVLRAREPGWFEHRLLKGPDADINLHVFTAGAAETGRILLFRDRLRASDTDRAAYLQVKRDPGPAWPRLAGHAPRPSRQCDGRSQTPD